jgi:hypothetical protein
MLDAAKFIRSRSRKGMYHALRSGLGFASWHIGQAAVNSEYRRSRAHSWTLFFPRMGSFAERLPDARPSGSYAKGFISPSCALHDQ